MPERLLPSSIRLTPASPQAGQHLPQASPQIPCHGQGGAGAAGFLLAAIPVLTLGLGGVEAAHWSNLRQTLSLALMESARAGATHQARPQAIATRFEQALHMAYPDPHAAARALQERRDTLGGIPWHIRIARPTPAAFLDHADAELRGPRDHPGQQLIRNDYQVHQHQRRQAQGWPSGRGPRSGLTIHEANTLVLELWWPHRPLVPGTATLVRALASLAEDPVQARLMAAGYLPFRRRVTLAMQSHPATWPDLSDGRVTSGPTPPKAWMALPGNRMPAPAPADPPTSTGLPTGSGSGPDIPSVQDLPDVTYPTGDPGDAGAHAQTSPEPADAADEEMVLNENPDGAACDPGF